MLTLLVLLALLSLGLVLGWALIIVMTIVACALTLTLQGVVWLAALLTRDRAGRDGRERVVEVC